MMKIKKGGTRIVFLTKKYAFKMPYLTNIRLAIIGILANLDEKYYYKKYPNLDLAKVIFCDLFGFLLIMEAGKPINDDFKDFNNYIDIRYNHDPLMIYDCKPENFAIVNGHLKKIDYGG